MWQLFNKLFGWAYVAVIYGSSHNPYRIRRTPLGEKYITTWWANGMIFLNEENIKKYDIKFLTKEK